MRKRGRPPAIPTSDAEHLSRLREYLELCDGRRGLVDDWVAKMEYRSEGTYTILCAHVDVGLINKTKNQV